jgi:hypothetical protein
MQGSCKPSVFSSSIPSQGRRRRQNGKSKMKCKFHIGSRVRHKYDLKHIAGTIINLDFDVSSRLGEPAYLVDWDERNDPAGTIYAESVLEKERVRVPRNLFKKVAIVFASAAAVAVILGLLLTEAITALVLFALLESISDASGNQPPASPMHQTMVMR